MDVGHIPEGSLRPTTAGAPAPQRRLIRLFHVRKTAPSAHGPSAPKSVVQLPDFLPSRASPGFGALQIDSPRAVFVACTPAARREAAVEVAASTNDYYRAILISGNPI